MKYYRFYRRKTYLSTTLPKPTLKTKGRRNRHTVPSYFKVLEIQERHYDQLRNQCQPSMIKEAEENESSPITNEGFDEPFSVLNELEEDEGSFCNLR